MPDKSLRPEDFNRGELRPENSEIKDLRADRVDFRPTQVSERPSWKPEVNEQSGTRSEWISVNSATFGATPRTYYEGRRKGNTSVAATSHSEKVLSEAVKGEYQYAKLGLLLGLATIIGGIILGLHGVTGHTSWTAEALGFESNINDAAPGVVLFIVGVFVVYFTKPRVKLGDLKG